ncbi:MAG: UpxY family transcription antiterminator [Myxococcota bacterium]
MKRWFAVHVRSNHERKVDRFLAGRAVESFLPTYRVQSKWSDREVRIEKPLFPGYLFAHVDSESSERVAVLSAAGVVRIVGFGGLAATIPDDVIDSLRVVAREGSGRPCPYLRDGMTVRITSGPFRGASGIVSTRPGHKPRLVVSIHLLGRSVAVPIEGPEVDLPST